MRDIENIKNDKIKIHILDYKENIDIYNYLKSNNKYEIHIDSNIKRGIVIYDVLIVGVTKNISINEALNIIDTYIDNGREIIAIKKDKSFVNFNANYLSNFLINNGCTYI